MKSRKRPFCSVEDGQKGSVSCHLANMSLQLGRTLHWDPAKGQVVGDKEAAALCAKPYRSRR